ncbi:MAG TPA: hypothetical protein VK249_01730 [Anaerolineales bacterium]|nr:hypothetical protein [Anaerolineales bacterium]
METMKARTRLFPYKVATIAGLVVMALGPVATMLLDERFNAMGLIFVLIPLVMVGLVLTGNRWLIIVVVGVSALFLAGGLLSPIVQTRLANPTATGYFILELIRLLVIIMVIATGLGSLAVRSVNHTGNR